MALLQISEPENADNADNAFTSRSDKRQRQRAIGIDLGTTHSLVATVTVQDDHPTAQVLPDADGQLLLPSAVRYLPDGEKHIGYLAKAEAAFDPKNTIVSVKRFMGRSKQEIEASTPTLFDFVDAAGMVQIKTAAGIKSPVEVSADILSTLRQRAETALGYPLFGAVITVPAYFDEAQRQATKDAARIAGLNVLRLLNEPTAAAIAYGLDSGAEGVYAVYDLGGGTFDLSILKLTRGVFEVIATGGDSALGGDDFDQLLFQQVVEKLEKANIHVQTPEAIRSLLDQVRIAKEALSAVDETTLSINIDIGIDIGIGESTAITVTEKEFAELTQPLIQRTLALTRKALRDARIASDDINGVILVGGATRMRAIRRAVQAFFGQPPRAGIDPDQVVALGAAIQADLLAGNRRGDQDQDWLLLDVTALSLGIETMGGLVEKIIPRHSTVPSARTQEFTTFQSGQTAMSIHVVQGERELVKDCRSLARFELHGIAPMPAGAARIRVTYQVDADGLLSVCAKETRSGVEASIIVKPSYGLSDEAVTRMLEDSFKTAETDMHARALRESQIEAEQLFLTTQAALASDAELLSKPERDAIERAMYTLQKTKATTDRDAIDAAIRDLSETTHEFAERQMNKNIRKALVGHAVH